MFSCLEFRYHGTSNTPSDEIKIAVTFEAEFKLSLFPDGLYEFLPV
jgi:hypothetical protein